MSLLIPRSSDSLRARVAIMAARKALQQVWLERWLLRYRAAIWLRRRPTALLPFRGGKDLSPPRPAKRHVVKRHVVKRDVVKREFVKREPRIVD